MKLLIIGAGVVGRSYAAAAAAMPSITGLIVADLDLERARAAAAPLGAEALQLDVMDTAMLVRAIEGADILGSAIGPATRFGNTVLEGAIAAGRPYVEIGDDPGPTLKMLDLNQRAQDARVNAVLGLGASPGITNMLAVAAVNELECVDRLITAWGSGGKEDDGDDDDFDEGVTAALEHWVEQVSHPVPIWRDGRIIEVEPLEAIQLDYPGIGSVTTHLVGHPEAVTLPRRYPELVECLNVMNFSRYVIASLEQVAVEVRSGRATFAKGAAALADAFSSNAEDSLLSTKAARYAYHASMDALSGRNWLPELCALAEGRIGERRVRVGASLNGMVPGGMGPMTGVPAAVAVELIAQGAVPGFGVRPAELALDADAFFQTLRPHLRDPSGKPLSADTPTVNIAKN